MIASLSMMRPVEYRYFAPILSLTYITAGIFQSPMLTDALPHRPSPVSDTRTELMIAPAAETLDRSPGEPALRTEELTKVYRTGDVEVWALRGVNLDLHISELVVLLGPSGSGPRARSRARS